MWAARNLRRLLSGSTPLHHRHHLPFSRSPAHLHRSLILRSGETMGTASSRPPEGTTRSVSTSAGRGMRSKVERRMRRETGKTLREIRRAKKLRRKLMTEEERLIYSLRRAKKKVALLLQKLKKYELPELPSPRHDPELLTAEQLQSYKKIGYKNKNYVPVGVRGVFGGVVQNMHLHWKFHETVQVCCDNYPKEKIKEMATMLARLSGGIVVNIHNVKTIIMFRGRNYRQPKNLIPINTLTKRKALFKARFEQALDSQKLNIKTFEQKLRRMGVNPEDPVAMASIQRVASTFFRAIDEKQGTPYVFHGENKPSVEVEEEHEDAPALSGDESDQEELDRFIAEIEEAADQEWAAEEAAEKEETPRIRYWNKESIGMRGGRMSSRHGRDSDEEFSYHGRDRADVTGRQRTTDVRKWHRKSESSGSDDEDWESEDEIESALGGAEIDSGSSGDDHNAVVGGRNNNIRGVTQSRSRIARRGSKMMDPDSGSDSDMFSESDDTLLDSD